jgi:phosphoglucosamine mutase
MTRKFFGTDGIRGKVGVAPITPDFVMRLGYAAGKVLAQSGSESRPTVLIGKDTRISGYMLEASLEAGFLLQVWMSCFLVLCLHRRSLI